jgi:hypothetical protein
MSRRPDFIQSPTLQQLCAVFSLIRKGRQIVSKAELTPEDAVALREIMDLAEREFDLAMFFNDTPPPKDFKRDLHVIKGALDS